MTPTRKLAYRTLERAEIDALLARHNVGRIAYTFRMKVDEVTARASSLADGAHQ